MYKILEGEDIKLYTEMVVKEDGMTLYGFSELESILYTDEFEGTKTSNPIPLSVSTITLPNVYG